MKRILILIIGIMMLTACGSPEPKAAESKIIEKKSAMSSNETTEYLGELLEPFLKLSNLEAEEQVYEVAKEIDENSHNIKRELKRDYEQDINEVDDLIVLADKLMNLSKDIAEGNLLFMSAYGEDIGNIIYVITTEHTDGDLPDNYAKVIGVENAYDLK